MADDQFYMLFAPAVQEFKDLTRAAIFGVIWRKAGNGTGICEATPETLGGYIAVNEKTIRRHVKDLVKDGYIIDHSPDARQRMKVKKYSISDKGLALVPDKYQLTDKMSANNEVTSPDAPENNGQNVPNEHPNKEINGQNVPKETVKGQNVRNKGQNVQQRYIDTLKTTSTTTARTREETTEPDFDDGSDLGFAPIDPEFGEICTLYQANIGSMNQIISDEIKAVIDEIEPPPNETPYQWFEYAITEAATGEGNCRNWKFIRAIIIGGARDGIKQSGSLALHKANHQNGASSNGHQPGNRKSKATGKAAGAGSLADEYREQNGEKIEQFLASMGAG